MLSVKENHAITADWFVRRMKELTDILPEYFEIDGAQYIDYFNTNYGMSLFIKGRERWVVSYRRDEAGEWYELVGFGTGNRTEFDGAVWRLNNNKLTEKIP